MELSRLHTYVRKKQPIVAQFGSSVIDFSTKTAKGINRRMTENFLENIADKEPEKLGETWPRSCDRV